MWLHHVGNWLFWFFGVSGVGSHYGFWSGAGSDLGEYTIAIGIFLALTHAVLAHNCEVHHCWRIGRHKTLANHCVCRKHHPDIGDKAPTATCVAVEHERAKNAADPC
jgi:hypothetical protein